MEFLFKRKKTYYALYPDGEIWIVNLKKERKRMVFFFDEDELFNAKGKPAKLKDSLIEKLFNEYEKIREDDEEEEAPSGLFDEDEPEDGLEDEDGAAPAGLFDDSEEGDEDELEELDEGPNEDSEGLDYSGLNIVPLDSVKYLINYKNRIFFVKLRVPGKADQGWVIVEANGGNEKIIPGTYTTKETAFSYLQGFVDRELAERDRINNRAGGTDQGRGEFLEGTRLLYDDDGKIYTGLVIERLFMDGEYHLKIKLDVGKEMMVREKSLDILCKTKPDVIVKDGPVKRKYIDKYRFVEEKERGFKVRLDTPADIMEEAFSELGDEFASVDPAKFLDDMYKVFCEELLKKYIEVPFVYKFCREYFMTHVTGVNMFNNVLGNFKFTKNEVGLNYLLFTRLIKGGEAAERNLVLTAVHEVVHYKVWPLENKMRNWIIKNLPVICGLDVKSFALKKWWKRFSNKKYSSRFDISDVQRIFQYAARLNGEEAYTLAHWEETPPQLISNWAIGEPLTVFNFDELNTAFIKRFRRQLEK